MTLSKKKKDYSLPANQIYTTLFDSLKNNNNFSEVSSDENTFQISVITLPSIKTHGEKMTITIESITDSASTIEIQSESLQEEYDCGRNALNVTVMFRTIDQLFKKTSNKRSKPNFITYDRTSQEKQLSKTVKPMSKIISITLAVILIVAILATAIYLLRSCSDDDNSNECGVCDGVGLVPNEGIGYSTCPYCKGAGITPQ